MPVKCGTSRILKLEPAYALGEISVSVTCVKPVTKIAKKIMMNSESATESGSSLVVWGH